VGITCGSNGARRLNIVPVAIAFFGAALSCSWLARCRYGKPMTRSNGDPHHAWALIPLSDALRTTGGTDLIAAGLSLSVRCPRRSARASPAAAMAVTPFLNNAATVLVMAPIAASFAARLGYNPDPFLMAVAIGAACDFLTPIGHQCNTLVMGPGGYRFGDYWRLGLPLSLIVLATGVPLIAFFWPV
jgi:di/tricarboxylate transporter